MKAKFGKYEVELTGSLLLIREGVDLIKTYPIMDINTYSEENFKIDVDRIYKVSKSKDDIDFVL